jgi:hypothetical protein
MVAHIDPVLDNTNPSSNKVLPVFRKGTNLFTTQGSLWCMKPENQISCEPDSNYILQPKSNVNLNKIDNYPYPYNDYTLTNSDLIIKNTLDKSYLERIMACNQRAIENRFRPVYLHIPDKFLEICDPVIGYESKNDAKRI